MRNKALFLLTVATNFGLGFAIARKYYLDGFNHGWEAHNKWATSQGKTDAQI